MKPPEMVKILGRPKLKRNRGPGEALKWKVELSKSRKGRIMTCSKCGEENRNARGCYKGNIDEQSSKKRKCMEDNSTATQNYQQYEQSSASRCYEPEAEVRKRNMKMKARKGQEIPADD